MSCGCAHRDMLIKRNKEEFPSRKYVDPTRSARNQVVTGYKSRGLRWLLSDEQCARLFASECFYCGAPPSNRHVGRGGSGKPREPYFYNGLDRIDNDGDYEWFNVVPSCMTCNRAKNTMGIAEFRDWLLRVARRWATGTLLSPT